jgi:6,7-dimethyl-8-ribityllumazine synthase
MQINTLPLRLEGHDLRIGIVQARFNGEVVDKLWKACHDRLIELGVEEANILHVTVPGALEIATTLSYLAVDGQFDALIALGAIIKGDTYHFEVVSQTSALGIDRIATDLEIPIANAVLTTYTEEQAIERAETKGCEAAEVAVEMANLSHMLESIDLTVAPSGTSRQKH